MTVKNYSQLSSGQTSASGFTLLEVSIAVVIMGLIIGVVLVGQDMIATSGARAQIAQLDRYSSAVRAFEDKYQYLPGDMTAALATQYNLPAGNGAAGHGDGNGIIENCSQNAQGLGCESVLFWAHLAQAGLVDGGFNLNNGAQSADASVTIGNPYYFPLYLPAGRINGNYVSTYSYNGQMYFIVLGVTAINGGYFTSNADITPRQAGYIDTKIDDGGPFTGNVMTLNFNSNGSTGYIGFPMGYNSYGSMGAVGTCATVTGGGGTTCGGISCTVTLNSGATSIYSNSSGNTPGCQLGIGF